MIELKFEWNLLDALAVSYATQCAQLVLTLFTLVEQR